MVTKIQLIDVPIKDVLFHVHLVCCQYTSLFLLGIDFNLQVLKVSYAKAYMSFTFCIDK